ncbi:DUF4183 domain-containing protein [Faecalispora anaeroviscerum]|uniref:DUF4183 domain-containing protein n=1 Tax=Faecalispora anaeroviscerum TaxID=2991836 RepID=UPI0024B98F3C|nr:DUF4183 domain-containing protein [Faecalispora anaeroviscerum]
MAKQLFRLAATNSSVSETSYFYKRSTAITVTSVDFSLPKATWIKGNGSAVGTGAFTLATNGYYNLFINGVLQQSSLYTVSSTGVVLTGATAAYTISASSPFTLTVANSTTPLVAIP